MQTDVVVQLSLGLAIFGGVTYALTQVIKPLIPHRNTLYGRISVMALPVIIGAGLGCFGLGSLMGWLSAVTGGESVVELPRTAALILGMFSGSFATQIHNAVQSKIKITGEQEG